VSARHLGAVLAAFAAAVCVSGCGKHDLARPSAAAVVAHHRVIRAQRRPTDAAVALPLPLTPAVAAAFAKAVELVPVDITGSQPAPRASASPRSEREAASCVGATRATVGGGRSPELVRGPGLERESISSSVAVLASAALVRTDLAYADSRAGLTCYGRVLRHSFAREQSGHVRLSGVRLSRLELSAPAAETSTGVRITARLQLAGSPLSVPLFVDSLSFGYGPAEIDLFTTSFVQPVGVRIEQQLLTLLWERAQRQRL
jgi:hypothetical protein